MEKEIQLNIIKKKSCHEIWNHLKAAYYRGTPIDAIEQMRTVFSTVGDKYDSTQCIGDFISLYETEWTKPVSLTATSISAYNKDFHTLLSHDKFKTNVLLTHLVKHIPAVVDNLTLKDYKTFVETKKKLLSTSLSSSNQESAFYTNTKGAKPTSSSPSERKKKKKCNELNCTWCAVHNPSTQKGHTWKECRKLKEYNENKKKNLKEKKEKKEKKETANVATASESAAPSSTSSTTSTVSTPHLHQRFMLDSGASSHMTNDLGRFKTLSADRGHIEIANGQFIDYTGKGTVILNCELPDGSLSLLHLNNILFVPSLSKSLFSWPVARDLGFCLEGNKSGTCLKRKDGSLVLFAEAVGKMEFIKEKIESVFSVKSFKHWHATFSYIAPTSLCKTHLFEDGHILPTPPTTFHCEPCVLAKSTHSVPKSSERKTTAPFELIHSDLSGRFPVKSIEGFEYYLTIVDDFSRASWIYFLKKKSTAAKPIKDYCLMLRIHHLNYSVNKFQ